MKFKYIIIDGQLLPPWYCGYAYRSWHYNGTIFYIMPINFIIRACVFIKYKWNRFRNQPSYVDLMINKVVNEREERRVKELNGMARRLGLVEDELIMKGLITDD